MSTTTFHMQQRFGDFLADGEAANVFRACDVEPKFALGHSVVFDFAGVQNMTDSFAFCLFSNLVGGRAEFLPRMKFKDCSPLIKSFITAAIRDGLSRCPH